MSTTTQRTPTTMAGRLGLSLFFLVFATFGLLFVGLMVRDTLHKRSTRAWTPTPCRILSQQVLNDRQTDDLPYTLHVRYRFDWNGAPTVSTQVNLSGGRYKDLARADRLGKQLAVGGQSTCYVNPQDPSQSVLEHESSSILWFLPLPLLFVLIGLGGIVGAWRTPRLQSPTTHSQPLSTDTKRKMGQQGALAAVTLFILFGSVFLYFFTLRPLFKVITARSWIETPCIIESSQIRSSRGSKSTTYRVDIAYRYTFQETEHRGNRYDFLEASSSGYESKQRILAQYPPGQRSICFVNPNDPSEAVLDRGMTSGFWVGIIPMVFMAAGLFALRHLRKQGKSISTVFPPNSRPASSHHSVTSTLQPSPPSSRHPSGSAALKPRGSRLASVVALLLFGLFWNGVISVFIFQIIRSFQRGNPEWFLTLFMVPFVLVGLGVIVALIHQFMALFNPTTHIVLDPGILTPGRKALLRWSLQGRTHRIHQLQIALEGHESATYRRGTNNTTAQSLFHQVILADLQQPADMNSGEVTLEIPEGSPPSIDLPNNRIQWSIRILGKIARWPDMEDTYICPVQSAYEINRSENPLQTLPSPASTSEVTSSDDSIKLGLKDGQRSFRPGDTVQGAVGWSRPSAPTQAEIRLFYFTKGRGTSDVVVVETLALAQLQPQEARPFSFQLPTSPPSIEGTLVSIIWAIEVVLQPGQVHARCEFTLSPFKAGTPIALPSVGDSLKSTSQKRFHATFRKP